LAPDGVDDRVAEQVAYYRAPAPEYDDWWERRDGYDFGPQFEAAWAVEVEAGGAALDRFGPTGDVLELAAGTGIFTGQLLRHAEPVTAVAHGPQLPPDRGDAIRPDGVEDSQRARRDGRQFTIVKRYWAPADLEAGLTALGWSAQCANTSCAFLYGSDERAR